MDSSKANSDDDDDDDDDRSIKSFFKQAHNWVIDSSNINLEECVLKSVQNVLVAKLLKEESFFSLQKNVKCKFLDKKQKKVIENRIFSFFGRKVVCLTFRKGFAQFFVVPSWNHANSLCELIQRTATNFHLT